jgi:hypothetical protein
MHDDFNPDDDFDFDPDFDAAGPGTGPDTFLDLDLETMAVLDGPSAEAFATRKKKLTRALVDGETGVQFASLALFAEPLFTLYELDPGDAFRLATEPEAVADDTVALLETARVLWAYLSLPDAEQAHKRQALASQLVGEDPSEDDWMALDGLLEGALVHYQALLPEEVQAAQQTGHPTLGFDALLHHPAFRVGAEADDATHAGYGPNGLSEVEARALFAQPLLESVDPGADADAFEDTLARADAYWSYAQAAGPDAAAAGRAFAKEHGASAEEAEAMLRRYRDLFPEHAR